MMARRLAVFVLVVLTSAFTYVRAQDQTPKAAHKIEVRNSPVSGKRMIFIDKKPFVILGAFNTRKADQKAEDRDKDLDAIKAAGLNTVCIEVPWQQDKSEYEKIDAFARAAGEKELWVVLSLSMVPPAQADDPALAISPVNRPYAKLLELWVKYVVDRFKALPTLLGYATQDTPVYLSKSSDAEFQMYLRNLYKLPQNLSQSWQYEIPSFEAATMQVARKLDYDRSPAHFARPSVDICAYKMAALSDLMRLWAQQIKTLDPTRLVFTGRLNDYKSIMCVPENYDVVVPGALPTVAEPDTVAHNPQAIDMARHGNLFAATPVLLSSGGQGVLNAVVGQRLLSWMNMAFLHGASGLWLSDWQGLSSILDPTKMKSEGKSPPVTGTTRKKEEDKGSPPGPRKEEGDKAAPVAQEPTKSKQGEKLSPLAQALRDLLESKIAESMPQATVAFLYEPFGEGVKDASGNPLYGFAEQLSLNEPNQPFYDFRGGTRYGQVDYLSHEDLLRVNLSQYGTIFAPLCLWLTPETEGRIAQYVDEGGVLVADLGIGMAYAGGTFKDIPPLLQKVFGVWTIVQFNDIDRNMEIFTPHPLFPSLQQGMMTQGVGDNGMAFVRPLCSIRPYGDTIPLGHLVNLRRGRSAVELTVHACGSGFGVFAPFRLWPFWRPEDDVYRGFHADLVQRGGIIVLNNEPRLFPTAVSVAALGDGVGAFNFSNDAQYAQVNYVGMGNLLYTNALTAVAPLQGASRSSLAGNGRSSSALAQLIDRPTSQMVTLHLELKPGEMHCCRFLPIQLEPLDRIAMARVVKYDKDQVELTVFGGANVLGIDQQGVMKMSTPAQVGARLTLYSGEYEIAPHSVHQITIVSNAKDKKKESKTLSADERGHLVIEGRFQSQTITITPGK